MTNTEIGLAVRERRLELGWTQKELAHRAGLRERVSITKLEAGKGGVGQQRLARIGEALGISLTETEPQTLLTAPANKLIIRRHCIRDTATTSIAVYSDTAKQLKTIRQQSGLSGPELMRMIVNFAVANIEIAD